MPKRITDGTPAAKASRAVATMMSGDCRSTPGIEAIGWRTPFPGTAKSGSMKHRGERWVSRTIARSTGERRRRRGRSAGKGMAGVLDERGDEAGGSVVRRGDVDTHAERTGGVAGDGADRRDRDSGERGRGIRAERARHLRHGGRRREGDDVDLVAANRSREARGVLG